MASIAFTYKAIKLDAPYMMQRAMQAVAAAAIDDAASVMSHTRTHTAGAPSLLL